MYVYGNGVGSWVMDILKMWGPTQLQSCPKSLTLRTSLNPVLNAQVCVYLTVHLPVTSRLYSTLSLPHWSKQTMMGRMDDQMDGWMNDETGG
jgi:hypothetical protein